LQSYIFSLAGQPQPARFSSNYAGIVQSNCPFSACPCPVWCRFRGLAKPTRSDQITGQCTVLRWVIARP